MKIKIDIDPHYEEDPVIMIQAKEWSKEVSAVMQLLENHEKNPEKLTGTQAKHSKRIVAVEEDHSILLEPKEIDFVYAEKRKVFAMVHEKPLEMKLKLYELEDLLAPYGFIRFSKSVIGNMNQIERFELSFNGNLCVHFKSGTKEYVTRKYVHILKEQLVNGGELHGS
ncbi:LytTR family transcriptional regulator [Sinobaca qinghaiensis]|uniref:LytTR family transcriptional regulator n=1 Tax=Sinobaca qinghaiensis TaxID=342944 RepID=A0A419V7J7_9BACL|nr:LytTR family DNA-binding domain-containing protein [Sinobaca qinghaiensis]RKD75958.1 LytTR family transcriptional regulator [Sinobaca qinghaiensis]